MQLMSKPRIFISHSASEDPPSRALLNALAKKLRTDGYRVLLDKTGLELGDNWRSKINLWIGGCDAAIVLLSESALESAYVAYEASILAFRKVSDPNFRPIPIFLDPVSYDRVQASLLAPTRIHNIQAVIKEVPQDAAIRQVLEKLDELQSTKTPVEPKAQHLSNLLEPVPETEYTEDAEKLGIDLGAWVPGTQKRLALALKMMGVGLDGSTKILRRIRTSLSKPRPDLEELIILIGSSWVDYRAVEKITHAARAGKSLGVNAQKPLTAKMYVIWACDIRPRDAWYTAAVDGTTGEDAEQDLENQIRSALSQVMRVDAEEVDDVLQIMLEEEEPVFIALPTVGMGNESK
jgi:TIR domain